MLIPVLYVDAVIWLSRIFRDSIPNGASQPTKKTNINPVSFDIHITSHGDELDATLSNKDSIFRYSFKQIKFNL